MPVKHQGDSFRHRKGERYVCWADVLEADNRSAARTIVLDLRGKGVRAFAEHNDDEGYSRVFIHEGDGCTKGMLTKDGEGEDDKQLLL